MKRKLDWLLRSEDTEILFEDELLIVVDKPANLLVLPDRYDRTIPNLYDIIKRELGNIFVVHRIDKETSGVVLFAKTGEAHSHVSTQFENHEVEKLYQAVVVGAPKDKQGVIDLPLREIERIGRMRIDPKRGKVSVTRYTVLEEFEGYAFVEARPETGRTHQIRVHLQAIGVPILADPLYGNGQPFFLSQVKSNYKVKDEEKPLLSRTALHALQLSFVHPSRKETMRISSPLPKDIRTVLNYLRKFRKVDG